MLKSHGVPTYCQIGILFTFQDSLQQDWNLDQHNSIFTHPTDFCCILIFSLYLSCGLANGLFLSGFPTENFVR